jgi:hypothetical protein
MPLSNKLCKGEIKNTIYVGWISGDAYEEIFKHAYGNSKSIRAESSDELPF